METQALRSPSTAHGLPSCRGLLPPTPARSEARPSGLRCLAALLARYPVELSQFTEGLLDEAFRKLFWCHAAGGCIHRNSFIDLA